MKTAGFIFALCLLSAFEIEKTTLEIRISNIRNRYGVVRISVYTAPVQYPYNPWRTYTVSKDSLRAGVIQTTIRDLEPGIYGLCFLDDENRSGQMENNMIGIPLEGFGFANNVKPFLKRPDYSHVLFRLNPGANHMDLITRYKN